MSKKILVMMLIIISAISFVKQPNLNVMADEKAKIEIWSESLNERIEHRSIEVGNSNPNFSIKVTPSDTTIENVTWVTENIGVATVEGNNSTATVYGVSEGSTKLVLSAITKKYGILNYDCVISIYTKINDISGVIKKTTTLYRGADSSSWVRTEKAKVGQELTIIGSCGNYYYVKLPDNYIFDDNRSKREAYVLKSDVNIPVTDVVLDKDNIVLPVGDNSSLSTEVYPNIASNKNYNYKLSDSGVAEINNGSIKTKKEGMTVITAVADNKEASCNVSVYTPINATSGTLARNTSLYAGASEKCRVKKNDGKKGDSLKVIGKCGSYYYVEFSANYFENNSDNKAFVPISDVYIPVERIEVSETNIIMNINQKAKINVKVYPEIATNKNVEFKVTRGNIYINALGEIKPIAEEDSVIAVKSKDKGIISYCSVQVLGDKVIERLDPQNKFKVSNMKTDLDGNYITFSECQGASEYIVFRKEGKKWEDIYYSYNNDSKNYRSVFDPGAKLGKKYKYKIVAYYKYVTYKNGKLVTERVTKTIISPEITTGTPELKANKQNNKKGVVKNIKLKWNKMSYDYNNKSLKGGYVISRKIGSGKKKQIKTINNKKTTNYTDSKVSKNKKYIYYIKAFYETKSGKKIYSPVRKIEVNTKK